MFSHSRDIRIISKTRQGFTPLEWALTTLQASGLAESITRIEVALHYTSHSVRPDWRWHATLHTCPTHGAVQWATPRGRPQHWYVKGARASLQRKKEEEEDDDDDVYYAITNKNTTTICYATSIILKHFTYSQFNILRYAQRIQLWCLVISSLMHCTICLSIMYNLF